MSESDVPLQVADVLRQEFEAIHGTPESGWAEPAVEDDVYAAVHALKQPRTALCLSGGGIRSATYCLGALQALASHRERDETAAPEPAQTNATTSPSAGDTAQPARSQLERIHYLSTISGGGYIGGWLTAWLRRTTPSAFDYAEVARSLTESTRPQAAESGAMLEWLRRYSNYLAPRRGWSTDTWSMVALFLRNLVLNWVVLVPVILLILLVPLLHLVLLGDGSDWTRIAWVEVGIAALWAVGYPLSARKQGMTQWGWLLSHGVLMVAAMAICIHWILPSFTRAGNAPGDMRVVAMLTLGGVLLIYWLAAAVIALLAQACEKLRWCRSANILRERLARGSGTALAIALAWVALHALVFYLPPLILTLGGGGLSMLGVGGAAGIVAAVAGFWEKLSRMRAQTWFARASAFALDLAAGVFVIVVLGAGGAMLNRAFLERLQTQIGDAPQPSAVATAAMDEVAQLAKEDYARAKQAFGPTLQKWEAIGSIGASDLGADVRDVLAERSRSRVSHAMQTALDEICDPDNRMCLYGRWLRVESERYATHLQSIQWAVLWPLGALFIALVLFGPWVVGANRFSLGSFYENRLVRGYLGASHAGREVDQYSGFDETDNLGLSECAPNRPGAARLFPVIGAALNLVRGSRLEWQQRKASSFSMSPLHCGNDACGYQPTRGYGDVHGVTLGRAMAVSGAAVSPNMGYHSSPLITFVLTFFNARLGWWLPNPGIKGRGAWSLSEPGLTDRPILDELAGRTNDERSFVYLSDGGHFDNLGLYEMVRRRCARILAIDATADPDSRYEDLAATIRKIRTDLGISIEFPLDAKTGCPESAPYCMAKIDYRKVDGPNARPGYLFYVKPSLDGAVPVDVWRYARSHFDKGDKFPHQRTSDQFFEEDQFESYRMLGFHNVTHVLKRIGSLESDPAEESRSAGVIGAESADNEDSFPRKAASSGEERAPLSGVGGMLQSWASIGALATAVTVGGVVGVAGKVALDPGGQVGLAPNQQVRLAPNQKVELSAGEGVKLVPGQEVGLSIDRKLELDTEPGLKLAPDQQVRLAGVDGSAPRIQLDVNRELSVLVEANRALAASIDRLNGDLAQIRTNTDSIRTSVEGVRTNTDNIGLGRSSIEGRGGSR